MEKAFIMNVGGVRDIIIICCGGGLLMSEIKALQKVRVLDQMISRVPVSLKKDQEGIPTRDKRVLNALVKDIYKELVLLTKKQREEL